MSHASFDREVLQPLNTPCLIIDKSKLENNIAIMQKYCNEHGMKLRPHAKSHKCSKIVALQMAGGATGICCARINEAIALMHEGNDILITSPMVSKQALAKAYQLSLSMQQKYGSQGRLSIVIDNQTTIDYLEQFIPQGGSLSVFLDVDPGLRRTGCRPENALNLLTRIDSSAKLKLAGIQTYAGHLMHLSDPKQRLAGVEATNALLLDIINQAHASGINIPVVSKGGTGTWLEENATVAPLLAVTEVELQAGSYIFMDNEYRECLGYENLPFCDALFVLSTVISVPSSRGVTIDAGIKSIATDTSIPKVVKFMDDISAAECQYFFSGDEHGSVIFSKTPQKLPVLGSSVVLLASHCDPTINLYRNYFVIDADNSIDIWMIDEKKLPVA